MQESCEEKRHFTASYTLCLHLHLVLRATNDGYFSWSRQKEKYFNEPTKTGLSAELFVVCRHYTHKLEEKLLRAFVLWNQEQELR